MSLKNKLTTAVYAIALFGFTMYSNVSQAQPAELQERLKGIDRVEDIMEIVESYYKEEAHKEYFSENEDEDGELAKWRRWGYYMSTHADENGRLVNVARKIQEAYEAYHPNARSSTGNWIARGPNNISGPTPGIGRIDRVAFDPVDPNKIYIGSPCGGLFRSTNGGSNWTPLTDFIPSVSISGIVISHDDSDKIYILTGDGDDPIGNLNTNSGYARNSIGVLVTYDAGATWRYTGNFPDTIPLVGYNLAQCPGDANVLLAATSEGIYRTSNGGSSWSKVLTGKTFEVKFKPNSTLIAYATQDGEFWRSLDGGVHWYADAVFNYDLPDGRVALAVTNANSEYVYLYSGWAPSGSVADCGDDPNGTYGGVFRSTDHGGHFTRQSNSPDIVESCCQGDNARSQSNYDLCIGVSQGNTAIMLTGGIIVWRSSDWGVSWYNVSDPDCSSSTGFVHTDIHDIEYNILDGNVYVCTDGGIVKSSNNGNDWTNISGNLPASMIYHLAGSLTDIDNMVIGLQDNGCKRRNSNTFTWDPVSGADGYDCIYDWNSSTAGYCGSSSKLYRFTGNGDVTIEHLIPASDAFFMRLCAGVNIQNLVLAGVDDIYKSTNAGASWTNKGASGWWDIERCPSNQNRFYAAGGTSAFSTSGSLYFSSDIGETWNPISNTTGYPTGDMRLTDIGVRPNNSANVWITFGGFMDGKKVYYSNLTGSSWENKSYGLPNVPVNAIQVDASNNVYIGTDIGVFYLAAGSDDWVPFWNRLPRVPISDLELYEADGIIRASTYGRGVWESDDYSTCVQGYNLAATLSGNRYYEASDSIAVTSTVVGGENTRVILKSNNYIIFKPGFEAKKYNNVHAYLRPCGEAILEDW